MPRKRQIQRELPMRYRGKKRRKGGGRKPIGDKPMVSRLARPPLASRFPVHVGLKVRRDVPRLRNKRAHRLLLACIEAAEGARTGFAVRHHSLQNNHLHLIVEAANTEALTRGMQSLAIRIAKALNRLFDRAGKVFADRFWEHILRTPREVRNALVYVINNARKHFAQRGIVVTANWIDPFSSASSFDGWRARASGRMTPRARTWLMNVGWRRHGLLRVPEVPALSQ